MTKEELIALSDLNIEDNIKYISSEAQGIAITLDSDRYAPNLCKLERAYICGRRKSEEQIEQLEKENADLKEEINKIAFARGNLEEENAELKKACNETQELLDKQIEATFKLDKEYGQLKDEWQEQVQKATDEGYARTLQTIQLTKAKELIEDMYDAIPSSHSDYYKDVMERARQFLSEVEKGKGGKDVL